MADTHARVVQAAGQGLWGEVLAVLEEHELIHSSRGTPLSAELSAVLVLAHLVHGELHAARLAYRRLSPAVQREPQVESAANVLRALWARNTAGAHQTLSASQWQGVSGVAAAALVEQLRVRTAKLLSNAYANIQVSRVAQLMGCDEGTVLRHADKTGWPHDTAAKALTARTGHERAEDRERDDQLLKSVAAHALFLEQLGASAQAAAAATATATEKK
eukprot:Hpha_TRINITY_DN28059_c0_g1::TRINITY_DN28059_c0_g1_i1::g.42581::m.42581/K12181/COPS8, CSN8; COP9 signalosome complex subunit 8